MKKSLAVGFVLLLGVSGPNALFAQEHSFGLRVGSFQFPESSVFTDGHFLIRDAQDLLYFREFEAAEFSGTFLEGNYEWRRDTDAHFSLSISGGVYSQDATHVVPGLAVVEDPRGGPGFAWALDADVTNTLEYTLYFVHVSPRYNFTTGKLRGWVGGGAGLWANLWREVFDASFLDIFSCDFVAGPSLINCTGTSQFRESDGDRRTILPITASVGLTWQFLPHWSLYVEDRYLFSADSSLTLFRDDSEFDISGNQVILGILYRL